jgi:hypothetical protein
MPAAARTPVPRNDLREERVSVEGDVDMNVRIKGEKILLTAVVAPELDP